MENNLKAQFLLRDDITFLNFGSFGACPKSVFEKYQQYQLELEQEPVQFITENGLKYLLESRKALGSFLNCHEDDLVYVTNPSYAVNIIAKNFKLNKDDEVLTTNLEYGACDRAINYYCEKAGAKYIRQTIELPILSKEHFIESFFKGLTSKTKMIFISHITSTTGLIFPVEEICAIAKQKGLITFVDGAHAPAHVPLNLGTLQADIYTGACHKWMMTPKGSSFLYVKKELQHLFDPLVISWGFQSAAPSHSQFIDYHQMQGTRDFSAFLCIEEAINFMDKNNWSEVKTNCRKMVKDNAERFCKLLNATAIAPITDEFIGQMYSTTIKTTKPYDLHRLFFTKYNIEVPVMPHFDKVYLRYSIQAFNAQQDLDKLYEATSEIIKTTNLIEG